jgi:predicted ester cyclase
MFLIQCSQRAELERGCLTGEDVAARHIMQRRQRCRPRRTYGALLEGFPDATMQMDEQLAERDLVATRKTFRGTHTGKLWDLPPSGNRAEWEFIDIMRVRDGKIVEHWTSMDLEALRAQMRQPK